MSTATRVHSPATLRARPTDHDGPRGASTAKPAASRHLDELFSNYGRALGRGDASAASRYYAEPTHVATPDTVYVLTSRDEIERSLAELCAAYRAHGLSWAHPQVETALEIGPGHWQSTVGWCHGGRSDEPPVYARYRYLVRRSLTPPRVGPRVLITAVTVVNAPSALAPGER